MIREEGFRQQSEAAQVKKLHNIIVGFVLGGREVDNFFYRI